MMQEKVMEEGLETQKVHAQAEQDGGEATAQPTTETPAGPTDAELIAQLKAEVAAAQAKADELVDKLQRSAAEFQNSRRRQEKQLADEIERASERLLKRLLPVVDDFMLAFKNMPPDVEETQQGWVGGFRQIQKKLGALLEDEGVNQIALDGVFDPTRHEAVTSAPHETIPSGHIIETLRAGYELKGRVLRPALVRVAL
jgi:molecular chaperone GrpE